MPIESGAYAFVPHSLPPKIVYSDELVELLSRADSILGELSGTGRLLPNPLLLVSPYLRQEAVYSSRIEGTQTKLYDLLKDDLTSIDNRPANADLHEVQNYVAALRLGIELLRELPFSLRLVREVHSRLMQDVRGESAQPGEFRRIQNFIGRPGDTLNSAMFVPPAVPYMVQALDQWERFANDDIVPKPQLIRCALLHQQFETIHPFNDGNGRVGRLLIILYLVSSETLSQPLLYLSAFFEKHRSDYYNCLQRVRTSGDWDGWLRFFLQGVVETGTSAVRQTKRLLEIREGFLQTAKELPRALQLIDPLLDNPYITYGRARRILGVSAPTAKKVINYLVANQILTQISESSWNPLFASNSILDALEFSEMADGNG